MITLETLGPARVRGLPMRDAERLLAQPKRWALLAFLTVEATDAAVPRDRVLGVFWPEFDQKHARANLRNALHFLRSIVGPGAIESVGDQLLVRSTSIGCDAVALVRVTTPDVALLDHYRGDFLEGIYVDEPEFGHWVDGVRSAVRARACALAWSAAEHAAAEAAWVTAAAFGRRAVELAVDVEAASQRLIRILDSAGDRAAALAEYERLAALLGQRYGVGPSPESEALVEDIRRRSHPAPAPGTPRRAEHGPDEEGTPAKALAILPFRSLGGRDVDGFVEGMAEDLAAALTPLSGLRVVSRTSVLALPGGPDSPVAEARKRLGADLVVEGSVRRIEDRVRIRVRLVETATDAQRWTGTYDRPLHDTFHVQSDVALSIAREMDVALSPRTHRRLRQPATRSREAHERYTRARRLWKRRSAHGLDEAIAQLESSVAIDPDFALGWAGLADAHLLRTAVVEGDPEPAVARAREALERALELDPDAGEARATLGTLHLFFDGDVEAAMLEYGRAVALSPGYTTARHWLGNLLVADGRTEEGMAHLDVALELDPLSALVHENVGLAYDHMDRLDAAHAAYARALDLEADYWRAHWAEGLALAREGARIEAVERIATAWTLGGHATDPTVARQVREALRTDGPEAALETRLAAARDGSPPGPAELPTGGPDRTWRVTEAILLTLLDRHDEALASLERARAEGSLPFIIIHAPSLDPLSEDARFRALLDELDFTPARWRG